MESFPGGYLSASPLREAPAAKLDMSVTVQKAWLFGQDNFGNFISKSGVKTTFKNG